MNEVVADKLRRVVAGAQREISRVSPDVVNSVRNDDPV